MSQFCLCLHSCSPAGKYLHNFEGEGFSYANLHPRSHLCETTNRNGTKTEITRKTDERRRGQTEFHAPYPGWGWGAPAGLEAVEVLLGLTALLGKLRRWRRAPNILAALECRIPRFEGRREDDKAQRRLWKDKCPRLGSYLLLIR